jgi:multidrug efflux system membrane fusion protein
VTSGNFVANGQTLLTTLVSLDPIYVSFDGDEQAYLKLIKSARAAAPGTSAGSRSPVRVGLADENGYPHQGTMVFVDNALDPATGTIRNRALLDNHERLFTPGLFARIRLLGGVQHDAVLVNDSAIGTDQTVRYVLVVGTGNKVEYRPVQLGPVIDGLRVVQSGLASGETIVVNGLQRVRPGAQVQAQHVAMREPQSDEAQPEKASLLAGNTKAGGNGTESR